MGNRFDSKDWILLEALQKDARTPYAELGRLAKLSAPTVAERVKRLEDRGVLTGFHAAIDPSALGRSLRVFVGIRVAPKDYGRFQKFVESHEEVLECHHLTGDESHLLQAAVESVSALEKFVKSLSAFGATRTTLVLSTAVGRRVFRQSAR